MDDATTPVDNPLLAAALAYANRGWPVFPCKPGEKVPATAHGCKDATTDAATIRAWWARMPAANVAIATGTDSGLYVVDIDGADGERTAALLGFPPTLEVRTPSGGRHLYYRMPPGLALGNTCRKLGPGIDTRGEGGYVLAPPSRLAMGGYIAGEPCA